jgi:hypothetical protein
LPDTYTTRTYPTKFGVPGRAAGSDDREMHFVCLARMIADA